VPRYRKAIESLGRRRTSATEVNRSLDVHLLVEPGDGLDVWEAVFERDGLVEVRLEVRLVMTSRVGDVQRTVDASVPGLSAPWSRVVQRDPPFRSGFIQGTHGQH
jgi:hypothetical protein